MGIPGFLAPEREAMKVVTSALLSLRVWAVSVVGIAVLSLSGYAWDSTVSRMHAAETRAEALSSRLSEHEKNDAGSAAALAAMRADIAELKERSLRIETKVDRLLMLRVERGDR